MNRLKFYFKAFYHLLATYNFGGGYSKREIAPAITLQDRAPVNLKTGDISYFKNMQPYEAAKVNLFEAAKSIITKEGYIFVNGEYLAGTNSGEQNIVANTSAELKKLIWKNNFQYLPEGKKYLLVHTVWSDNYNHWLSEAMQKLFMLKQYFGERLGEMTLLLPHNHNKPYITDSLKLTGVSNIEFIKEGCIAGAPNAVTCSLAARTGNYRPAVMQAIRAHFCDKLGLDSLAPPTRNIYIARKTAAKRFVLNEADVIDVLRSYKFEILDFEGLPLAEQVKLMHGCKNLVSIHGAGLTNMMFMRDKGNIMEFRLEGDRHMNLFHSLASAVNLNYFYQLCASTVKNGNVHEADLTVDIPTLKQNIELMLATA